MGWAFEYMQREGPEEGKTGWHREEKGGSVYLRLSTRPIEQIPRQMTPELNENIIAGGYWLRRPEPATQLAIVYMGALAPEAIEAAALLSENRGGSRRPGHHLGRSADGRLAWCRARTRAGRRRGTSPHRDAARGPAARRRHHHALRWSPGGTVVDRRRRRPSRQSAGRRAFRPVRLDCRALCALRSRRRGRAQGRRGLDRPPGPLPSRALTPAMSGIALPGLTAT